MPWILAVLVVCKMCAAAWIATRLSSRPAARRSRARDRRRLLARASCSRSTACSPGSSTRRTSAHFFLVLLAILAVPLVRPSAVPLALAWNRHRGALLAVHERVGGRRPALRAALVLLAVPVALALVVCVSFYVRNRDNGGFVSSGEKREYLLYVPKSYDPARPTPLVISMHGAGLWPGRPDGDEPVERGGRRAGVHRGVPVRRRRPGAAGLAHGCAGAGLASDVRFIAELIDTLRSSYNIDRDADLRRRPLQRRRHGFRPLLHAVRSDRGGRAGGLRPVPAVELVQGPASRCP